MTIALVGSIVVAFLAVALAYLVLWVDRFRWEALPSFVLCVAWGAACGALWAQVINPALRTTIAPGSQPITATAVAAIAAVALVSLLNLAGIALAARARVFAGASDGLLHGFAAGVGFATVLSVSMAVSASPDQLGLFAGEVLVVVGFWSGWLGLGAGVVKIEGRPARRALLFIGTVLGGSVAGLPLFGVYPAENLWLTRGRDVLAVLVPISCLVGLAGLLVVSWLSERRIIGAVLAAERSVGVVPDRAVRTVPTFWLRVRAGWWSNRDERRAVNELLLTLALRQHRLQQLPAGKARIYGLEIGRLRQRAREIFSKAETPDRAE